MKPDLEALATQALLPHQAAAPVGSLWPLNQIVNELHAIRADWRTAQQRLPEPGSRELPSRDVLTEITHALRGALFPLRLGPPDLRPASEDFYVGHTLDTALNALLAQVKLELHFAQRNKAEDLSEAIEHKARGIVREFAIRLPRIRRLLDSDVEAAYLGDPAARSVDEILLCYPGIIAIIHHRLAHELYQLGVPLLARIVAELAHAETGIDIHPGARIGSGFFIDHGTGVVIGETAIIGERVRLYQAVTLGAKRFDTDESGALHKGQPRHPIVEDNVVIYAGATILGRITIGAGSAIGGNVWLTRSVPAGSVVTQASIRQETHEAGGVAV
ncbi:Serine acetyltransferase [Andreprevotia sp. IGB-42]|uniref:serine O-acetyltransferase EpsC n=1 Tax=Andreprevotia sp. IGB-42 TaxID=2497473 RepID=UPI001356F315|nr:serine O-acetyltransferase EpsC [Andreprevotia sp. IGB-42]KAF0815309.1 Serine acetyltransferase [Andreprevotia sp. IGB-42]